MPMPRRVRPHFPKGPRVPNDPKLWISWVHAADKLRNEEVYWLSTSDRTGKPHAAPVWGIWRSDRFCFETNPVSAKGRNLRENPMVVVHIQDGLDTVIVEGIAVRVTDSAELKALSRDYVRKYDYRPDWSDADAQIVFKVLPRIAHAWHAPKIHTNTVNFVFQEAHARRP